MNSVEQKQRKSAIEDLRTHVHKTLEDYDKATLVILSEHAKAVTGSVTELRSLITEHDELNRLSHLQMMQRLEILDGMLKSVHDTGIKSEALLARRFWGRFKWLLAGK